MASAMMVRRGVPTEARPAEMLSVGATYLPRVRPHLCFVAPQAWPVLSADPRVALVGGAEVQQSTLARLFAANGYRVSMICLDYGQREPAMIDGVTVYKAFRGDAGVPVLRFLHPRLTSMWRALSAVGAEIYYCRAAGMLAGVVAQYCRRHGRRSIYAGASNMDFVRGEGGQIRYARDRWIYRRGLAAVDRIVAQNEFQRETCRTNYGRDALIIPSCYVPPPRVHRGEGDRVLWVATIHEGKRPELLLELAARLPHRRFTIVGGPAIGGERFFESVRRAAARLPNVELTGFLPLVQAEPWFDRAKVFVNTSVYEGMPNTFLQAWARGVPTVATVDVGTPVNRVFRDIDEGARAIESFFQSRVIWESASQRCREYFERTHSSAEVFARYARLFDELVA
jgi:glycosyltransferase involved in cell wall biosynthesis